MAAYGQRRPDAAGQHLASNDALLALPSSGKAIPVARAVTRIGEAWGRSSAACSGDDHLDGRLGAPLVESRGYSLLAF